MVKSLKNLCLICFAVTATVICSNAVAAENDSVRTIRLRQDDAQVRFESKVYELKNASAQEILPFVNSAVLRYDRNSTVRYVNATAGKGEALLVSTGKDFIP